MKKGLNKSEREKATILQKAKQCLIKAKAKTKQWLAKTKELITKNKKTALVGGVATIVLAVLGITAMFQTGKNTKNVTDPELARAMNYEQVQEGEENIEGTENVKFDAFFLRDINNDGNAEGIRGTCKEIGKEDTLYMELNVQTAGYLKDAKITVDGKNFYLQTTLPKDEQLQDNYIGSNIKEIKFNSLTNGTQKLLTGIVRSGDYSYNSSKAAAIGSNINNYSQVNSVTLNGTYVDEAGQETEISKTVNFNIDWYGTTSASIYGTSQNKNIENAINEQEGTINLDFTVYTEELERKLNLKSNHVEAQIPELNGYAPIDVIYTGSNATANYNPEIKTIAIDRTAEVEEDGSIKTGLAKENSYNLKIVYPIESYQTMEADTIQLKIPVKTYYEGYNNSNIEFENPYRSNIAKTTIITNYEKPRGSVSKFEITVGKQANFPNYRHIVSKDKPLKIYNGQSEEEKNDQFLVVWTGYIGDNTNFTSMVMKETKTGEEQTEDKFIKNNGQEETTEGIITNVGIYFTGANKLLGENGWIKVYDEETGNLLETFTKKTWNKYNQYNPYKYEVPVKHIKIETSEIVEKETALYVYNVKEIDDEKITTKYEKSQFDQLQYIQSTLTGYVADSYVNKVVNHARYEAPISVATIGISKNTISTQATEKNMEIKITAKTDENNNLKGWENGSFLIKLPPEIIDIKINNIYVSIGNAELKSYEIIEQEGAKFIKIITENETPQECTITLNVDISPDPRVATTTKPIELYASNENISDYYYKAEDIYDVNNNLNTKETVNHTTVNFSMISPNSLLTNQTATNYDAKESMIISPQLAEIKPIYAVVDQQEEQKATIGVQLRNNYTSTISEISVLGKIPFKGNTYVISGGDLGSTFTTQMTEEGITIPEELENKAKIYYSENETPDKELNKEENGWKTKEQIQNWDNVKTFLIDLGDYVMPTGKEFVFNYTVKMPKELEFNKETYSHHGVYFSLDTEHGKYKTQTEPNKIGFRIAQKYEVELQKYQIGREKVIPGATYSFTEMIQNEDGSEAEGATQTGVTNENGSLKIANLYAERIYEVRETKTPDDYELNQDVIRFIAHVDQYGKLTIEKLQGNTKEEITAKEYQATIKVEEEVKAGLKITKIEEGTDNKVAGASYKLTGKGFSETGRIITTNVNGKASMKGISIGEEYTLQEVKAEGYYLANPIKFKVVNKEGNYVIEILEGEIVNQTIIEEDSIPTLDITLQDKKMPSYDLQITKIKKEIDVDSKKQERTYIEGAKFKLYKGTKEIGEYITDREGKITITGLYQYEKEQDIEQTYTLKEVYAPEGYTKIKDIVFSVMEVDGQLQFQEETEDSTKKQYTTSGNTINLIVEDAPTFRLIKKDGETKLPVANVKFAIYNGDGTEEPATNSKGEIIGTKEVIEGKEYYIVTTNENGEIVEDLAEGIYKAVEIQAPEQYNLENDTYYFGIGTSSEGRTEQQAEWAELINMNKSNAVANINTIKKTKDGGYIVGGTFEYNVKLKNGQELKREGVYYNNMIIKYNKDNEIEWAKEAGGWDYMPTSTEVIQLENGDYIVGGVLSGTMQLGNGHKLTIDGRGDNIILRYNEEGEIAWGEQSPISARDEGYKSNLTATRDGGYIIGCRNKIIKYSKEDEIEWTKEIKGSCYINSLVETQDGGIAVGGRFYYDDIDLGNGITLSNNGYYDGMVIKYNKEGEAQWAKVIGGSDYDDIDSVIEAQDGGIVIGCIFRKYIELEGRTIQNRGLSDAILIKYSKEGELQWHNQIGGTSYDSISSIEATKDGGVITSVNFDSKVLMVETGRNLIKKNEYGTDGCVIKYSKDGNVQWTNQIGGNTTVRAESIMVNIL